MKYQGFSVQWCRQKNIWDSETRCLQLRQCSMKIFVLLWNISEILAINVRNLVMAVFLEPALYDGKPHFIT